MTQPLEISASQRRLALGMMAASAFLFAAMSAFVKVLVTPQFTTHPLPASEVALLRYLGGIIFLIGFGAIGRISLWGVNRKVLWARGVSGGIASALYFVSIQKTSLTNATLLNYTFVIWGPIIAYFVLKELFHDRHKIVLPIALAGVVLITRPDFGHIHAGDAIALFSGFMAATALVSVRLLRRTETATAIFFYFNLVGVPIALLLAFATKSSFVLPTYDQVPFLFGVIATSVAAQMMMTYGYRALNTAEGGLLSLTTNVYSALLAFLFFADPLPWQTLVGGGMILLSAASLQFTPPNMRRADVEPSE